VPVRNVSHGRVRDVTDACWSTIGVQGDSSCSELPRYVHCRNCVVYSSAAVTLLDRESSSADVSAWTSHFAKPKSLRDEDIQSVMIFRIADEWLALPASSVEEVADQRPVHRLPHRRDGAVLGLVNVRGELLVCVSLGQLLETTHTPASPTPVDRSGAALQRPRLLVIRRGDARMVFPADEVHGMHRCARRDLNDLPSTIARSGARHASAVLTWAQQSVGLLDIDRVFQALERTLA
jgi:chemotaxis-related protein WspD